MRGTPWTTAPEVIRYPEVVDSGATSRFIVRERRDSDAAALVPALVEVHRLDGYPILERHASGEWLFGGAERAWVAEADGIPVAHVSVVRDFTAPGLETSVPPGSPTILGLARLFVAPAGRGLGAASALIAHVEEYAAETGLPLALEVVEHNTAAIALYERRGWTRVGSYSTDWFGDEGPHPVAHVYLAP
jgi:GNAT superfamily N-acetyltransferase